jgi:hypothetical protein
MQTRAAFRTIEFVLLVLSDGPIVRCGSAAPHARAGGEGHGDSITSSTRIRFSVHTPDYRISNWQESVSENPSLFTTRCSLTDAQHPFGVRSAVLPAWRSLPVYPEKQTFSEVVGTSHLCQQGLMHRSKRCRHSITSLAWASSNCGTSRPSEKALTPSHPRLPSTPWYQLFAVLKS